MYYVMWEEEEKKIIIILEVHEHDNDVLRHSNIISIAYKI